ncbi:hypothetical protein GLOTRDRAFT_127217 [Gloeophyllum trabeum ATCC 11539]|uniref:Fungal-type protein kinase domain-containing protein n=1 Tax=Gloeophyllum trabeum (strain ATCC 11539 / FP-39264 / Madison 617) TaxID=670483 RepID=S7QA75_GLOTA|nr:uncharacterized protein GLOTRDRAFT_127217 [Gloeophyllum trabeum ATCC 11539]EPQ56816.1 hypothetical protein GLOTRDRAFT_127217 [Gloeophyllum trabeum ATCC 11539]
MDVFLQLCFPSIDREEVFATFTETRLKELLHLLNPVEPGDKESTREWSANNEHPTLNGDPTFPRLAAYNALLEVGKPRNRACTPAPEVWVDYENSEAEQWTHALGIIEVKPEKDKDPGFNNAVSKHHKYEQVQAWNEIQQYGSVAFRAVPRCYMLGIGFYDDVARFYRWDRSAVIFSESFHYKSDVKPLVQFLHALGTFGNKTMGADSSITTGVPDNFPLTLLRRIYHKAIEDGVVKYDSKCTESNLPSRSSHMAVPASPSFEGPENCVTLGGPLFSSRSLLGRGTTAWLALSATAAESTSSVGKEIRQCFVVKDSWREEGRLPEHKIYERIHQKGHIFGVARCRGGFDIDSVVHEEEKRNHTTFTQRIRLFLPEAKFSARIHYRCVLDSIGIPLSRFPSTRQLVKAVRDAVKGLCDMAKAGILHRDISASNIMISASRKEEHEAWGFLIDPEYAYFLYDEQYRSDLLRITGTIQFISLGLQNKSHGVEHRSWHDLESVYWVVLHTLVCHANTNITPERVHRIFDDEEGLGKHGWISAGLWNTVEVTDHPPLTQCLRELGRLVHSHHQPAQDKNLLTHELVLKALEDALRAEDWPKADPAALEFEPCNNPTKPRNLDTSEMVSSDMRCEKAIRVLDVIASESKQSVSRKRKAGDDIEVQVEAQSTGSKRSRV